MADPLIAALRAERVGYAARGLTDRIAAVDAELRRLGAEPPVEEATKVPPERPGGARPAGTSRRGGGRPQGQTG